jgi:hypothetical protein
MVYSNGKVPRGRSKVSLNITYKSKIREILGFCSFLPRMGKMFDPCPVEFLMVLFQQIERREKKI